MRIWKFALPALMVALLGFSLKAEDAAKADEPKAADAKPADPAKPVENGELPKTPDGTSPLNSVHADESLVGTLHHGTPHEKGEKMTKAEKKAAKGGAPDSQPLYLEVAGKKIKGDKDSKKPRDITLTAEGAVLAQLKSFAEKGATVKVTGALSGDTMAVKEASEAPSAPESDKKKKKNNT